MVPRGVNGSYAAAFIVLSILYAVLISILAVLLEDIAFRRYSSIRDLGLLIGAAVLENLGYRQLTVWWRVRAFWNTAAEISPGVRWSAGE